MLHLTLTLKYNRRFSCFVERANGDTHVECLELCDDTKGLVMSQEEAKYYKTVLKWIWLLSCPIVIILLGAIHAWIQIGLSKETVNPFIPAFLTYIKDVLPSVSATIVAFLVVYFLYAARLAPSQLVTHATERESSVAEVKVVAPHIARDDTLVRQCGIWVESFPQTVSPDFFIGCFYQDEKGVFHYDGTRVSSEGAVQHHWHSKALACADGKYVFYLYKTPREQGENGELPYSDGVGVISIHSSPDSPRGEFTSGRFSDRSKNLVDVKMRRYRNIAPQDVQDDPRVRELLSRNGVSDEGRALLGLKIARRPS